MWRSKSRTTASKSRAARPARRSHGEVKAIRNDLWVQRYGYQTEQEKEDDFKGKYLQPRTLRAAEGARDSLPP
jgi:hypothetical protein